MTFVWAFSHCSAKSQESGSVTGNSRKQRAAGRGSREQSGEAARGVRALRAQSSSSARRYSPQSAWWKTTMALGSALRHSAVDLAVTPNPSGTSGRQAGGWVGDDGSERGTARLRASRQARPGRQAGGLHPGPPLDRPWHAGWPSLTRHGVDHHPRVAGRAFGDAPQPVFQDVVAIQELHLGAGLDPDLRRAGQRGWQGLVGRGAVAGSGRRGRLVGTPASKGGVAV